MLPVSSSASRVPSSYARSVPSVSTSLVFALPVTAFTYTIPVLPLIVTSLILAVQQLREMSSTKGAGGKPARWTIGYYVLTTLVAIVHGTIASSLGWVRLMTEVGAESLEVADKDKDTFSEREEVEIHQVVVQMFESLIPSNVNALATDSLLAVLVTSVIVGYLIKGPESSLLRATREVERIITVIITALIKMAPTGVFFLILPNLFRLKIEDIGRNLGVLMGGALSSMALHLFIVLPLIYFLVMRENPYAYWLKGSPAWVTAWGTASSAATLSVTLKCAKVRGIPDTVAKFVLPLGCLINMDGYVFHSAPPTSDETNARLTDLILILRTAIYFPITVVFLAATQGITLNGAQYVIICLLSTLASIGTTPIPSSSLVLTVMIAGSVNVPVTGMYAVVVAIDWFIDRFRTAVNVSGDLFAAPILTKITQIKDMDDSSSEDDVKNHAGRV